MQIVFYSLMCFGWVRNTYGYFTDQWSENKMKNKNLLEINLTNFDAFR